MVEIMKADNGYILLDDIDGVCIESDFDRVIGWLRVQFNECDQLQSIPVGDGGTGGYYIINNATSDEYVLGVPLELAIARNVDGTAIVEGKQYPVTLDVRPVESTVEETTRNSPLTPDSGERAMMAERT